MTGTLLIMALSGLIALTLTPLVRTFARARGWMDRPDGQRKRHTAPVPRIGGVAVYGAFTAAAGLVLALEPIGLLPGSNLMAAYLPLIVGGAAVLAVGLCDDIVGVRPATKLLVQAAAASYLYFCGFRIDAISNPFGGATVSLGLLSLPLTLAWFVGMSNAFNLIDGLDGLAAGIGLFSTTTIFIAAVVNERWEIVLLSAALGGALLGFLRYNFNPASIFLGDSGSLFVGFALAAFAIRGSMKSSAAIAVAAPLLALAVPLVDAGIAVMRRLISGRRVFEADSDHIHHRMLRLGFTPRGAVVTLYGVAALFGAASLLTMTERSQVIGVVVLASSVVTWIGIQQLGYGEFGELQRVLRQGLQNERQAIGNNVYVKSLRQAFAETESLAELWSVAIQAAERLGFESLELQLEPRAARALGPQALPASFPTWRAARTPAEARSSWAIPLAADGQALGRLVLARDLRQPSACDSSFVVEAISSGLAPRLAGLLADERSESDPARAAATAALR